jgi:diguanylate cyclase (GGDEF)-like protein
MLAIDIFTCYTVGGAGALVGVGLMAMIRTDQPRVSYALGLFRWALLCLTALLSMQLAPLAWRADVLKGAIGFAGAGVIMLAWAFRQLNGRRTNPLAGIAVTLTMACALWLAGSLASDTIYVRTVAVVFSLGGVGMALDQGLLTWRNQQYTGSNVILMLAACEFALNWLVLLAWAFIQPGPYPLHWLHAPGWILGVTGLSFALLPLAVAAVVFAAVNDRLMQQLKARALSDDLTGALSRKGLRELGERLVALQTSQRTELAVLMIDLDFFSDVNDRYGHATGDDVLRHVTQVIRDHLREDALLARYGGEEFTVLLPVRSRLEAQAIAERLRETVELTPCESRQGQVRVTISIGVTLHGVGTSLEDDLARADASLYAAKHAGRNRVVCIESDQPQAT